MIKKSKDLAIKVNRCAGEFDLCDHVVLLERYLLSSFLKVLKMFIIVWNWNDFLIESCLSNGLGDDFSHFSDKDGIFEDLNILLT
jgi:hypothetical protein